MVRDSEQKVVPKIQASRIAEPVEWPETQNTQTMYAGNSVNRIRCVRRSLRFA